MATGARPYRATLGHVRLNVHDLQRAIDFYTRFLHLQLIERRTSDYAFLSRGRDHHIVALFQADRGAPLVVPGGTSLDHIAFEVRGRQAFARAFQALTNAGVRVTTVNNGISWSIYFQDPDGTHLEIFRDVRNERGGQKRWRGVRKPLGSDQILAALSRTATRRVSRAAARRRRNMDAP